MMSRFSSGRCSGARRLSPARPRGQTLPRRALGAVMGGIHVNTSPKSHTRNSECRDPTSLGFTLQLHGILWVSNVEALTTRTGS